MTGPPIYLDQAWMLDFIAQGLRTALWLSVPMLVAAVAVGVVVSVFQAATQVQEQTLSFVPKIVATFVTVMFCGPWIAAVVVRFMTTFLVNIPNFVVK